MKIYATRRDKEEDLQRTKDKEAKDAPALPPQTAAVSTATASTAANEFVDYEMESLF